MRTRPARLFLVSLLALVTTGATAFWIWHRLRDVPMQRMKGVDVLKALFLPRDQNHDPLPTLEARRRNQAATNALIHQISTEYPALRIPSHPVPDAENGFLQLYQFSEEHDRVKSPALQELRGFLESKRWDAEEAKRLLASNAEMVARVEAIAALNRRSTACMPEEYTGFLQARWIKLAADVLLLKARLAAEAKDEQGALRLTKAALNLGSHLREVEEPNLLGETVTILTDLTVIQTVHQHLLPALGRDADFAQWKAALHARSYSPADFARVMRGEWNASMRHYVFPILVDRSNRYRPKDADEFARVISFHYQAYIARLHRLRLAEMSKDPGIAVPGDAKKLSPKSYQLYEMVVVGNRSWSNGYQRAAVIVAQSQAAFDLLILEQNGTALTSGSTTNATPDPLAEKPFSFDPTTRALKTTTRGVDPLKLPF